MELILIVVVGIALLVIWNSSRDAIDRTREQVDRLQREMDFLRSQVAGLARAAQKPEETKPQEAAARAAQPATPAVPPAAKAEPAHAAHAVAPSMAAFTPATPFTPETPERFVEKAAPKAASPQPAPPAQPIAPAARTEAPSVEAGPAPEERTSTQSVPKPPEPQAAKPAEQPKAPPLAMPPPAQPAVAFQDAAREPDQPKATKQFSFEQTLGANWLNKVGVAFVVVAVAWFLAWRLQSWGPAGKVLSGFAVSIALLGGGLWLERKPMYRIFARGGIGGGWALAYFTTFAMYHLQAARIVDSLAVDLVLMLLVAAGMVAHSLRYRSQTVTSLAFMLGFATLLTSHVEEPNQTVVFSLVASAILATALVVVTMIRHWAVLEFCGLIAVYVSHFVWLNEVLPSNHGSFTEFWPSTALILLYWLIFRLAYVMRTPLDKKEENLSSVSAIVNSGGVLGLLKFQSAHPEWAFWALVVIGVIEMGLAYWARERRRQAFVVLSTIAVVLLVSSVPFRFHGVSWPVLWLVQAQVLAVAGLRLDEPVFRRLGLLAGVITGGVLALHDVMPLAMERLVAPESGRHWSLTAGLGLAAILYWTHAEVYPRRWPEIKANALETLALSISSWLALGAAATCLWVVLPNDWLPVGWLALFLALVIAGHRFSAVQPLLEGDVVALGTAGLLTFNHVLPVMFLRLGNPDPGHHAVLTTMLVLAALAYWLRSEVFPRVLPRVDAEGAGTLQGWLAFIVPCASWLGLGAAAAAMWAGMPDRWLPLGWIGLFVALVIVGHWFHATMPPLEGDVLAIGAAGVLLFHQVLPLVLERVGGSQQGQHPVETTVLSLAALGFWARAELLPRTLPKLPAAPNWDPAAWEAVMLPLASCIGTASAAAAMWVALPPRWVAVGWLVLMLVLGLAADWIPSGVLAVESDVVALAAVIGLAADWDLWRGNWNHRLPLMVAVALVYCGMRRKTVPGGAGKYVATAYSWAAVWFLMSLTFDIFHAPWTGAALTALCVALFEIGLFARKGFLRWQGYAFLALAFTEYLGNDLPYAVFGLTSPPAVRGFTLAGSHLIEVLILIAGGYWLLERTRGTERVSKVEHGVGLLGDALGTISLVVWFGVRFPFYVQGGEGWIAAIWAAMATALMALAWLMRRRTFLVQAIALAIAAALRGMLFDLVSESQSDFWHGTLYRLAVCSLVLLAGLPFAFGVRGVEFWADNSAKPVEPLGSALRHPEQWFFFLPFGLMVLALAVKLSSGHITIAWSLLGLATFLLALAVGERSFRLAGLTLLLASVAKILLMDVWKLSTPDKIMTLITLGIALISVSLLYTRFSTTIRKYL